MTKLHLDIQTCLALPASSAPEFSQKRASASYLPLLAGAHGGGDDFASGLNRRVLPTQRVGSYEAQAQKDSHKTVDQ